MRRSHPRLCRVHAPFRSHRERGASPLLRSDIPMSRVAPSVLPVRPTVALRHFEHPPRANCWKPPTSVPVPGDHRWPLRRSLQPNPGAPIAGGTTLAAAGLSWRDSPPAWRRTSPGLSCPGFGYGCRRRNRQIPGQRGNTRVGQEDQRSLPQLPRGHQRMAQGGTHAIHCGLNQHAVEPETRRLRQTCRRGAIRP